MAAGRRRQSGATAADPPRDLHHRRRQAHAAGGRWACRTRCATPGSALRILHCHCRWHCAAACPIDRRPAEVRLTSYQTGFACSQPAEPGVVSAGRRPCSSCSFLIRPPNPRYTAAISLRARNIMKHVCVAAKIGADAKGGAEHIANMVKPADKVSCAGRSRFQAFLAWMRPRSRTVARP